MDQRGIAVVITDAELFPVVDPIQLFPEGFVVQIVKIQASDGILSARSGVGVGTGDDPEPCTKGGFICGVDDVLYLVAVNHVPDNAPFGWFPVTAYHKNVRSL